MSELAHGNGEAALELLEALGFKPDDHITSITLRLRAGELVKVFVEHEVHEPDLSEVAKVVKRYTLVPK